MSSFISRIIGLTELRIVRFLISGGIGFASVMLLLYFFTDILGWWYLASFVVSFFIAQSISFTLQKFFTFRDATVGARRVGGQAAAFVSLGAFNLLANSALLYALVEYGQFHYLVAQVIISLIIAVWSFLFFRYIFRANIVEGEV